MSSNLARLTIPDGVAGNISEFESDVLSSNLSPVADVVFSLSGKAAHCECEEQGSIPGDNQRWLIVQRIRMLCYERRDESSNLSKPTKWMNSLMEKQFPSKE